MVLALEFWTPPFHFLTNAPANLLVLVAKLRVTPQLGLQRHLASKVAPKAPQGVPNGSKRHSKTACYMHTFSSSKKHPPNFDFGLSWLPLGPPKTPPIGIQGLLKTTLGSILGHLGCNFNFLASLGVPPGPIFIILY